MKPARGIAITVRVLAALTIVAAILWHVGLPHLDGKDFSYMNAFLAFLLVHGCFICLGLTILLAWIYFRHGKPHTGIFLIAVLVGLSPALRMVWPHKEWAAPPATGVV